MTMASRGSNTALVLAGGGALGAYEAGVLHYALETLAGEIGRPPRIDFFSGTSVGGLNASYLAANAHDLSGASHRLVEFWRSITFDRILGFGGPQMVALVRLMLGRGPGQAFLRAALPRPRQAPHPPVAGIFDTTPLHDRMRALIPWRKLGRNLTSGRVKGITLCATEICTGKSIVFCQMGKGGRFTPGRDPMREVRHVTMDANYAMASAAIPFIFPSVQIDGICYTDGGLRQNTSLNPALRMGADRVLVVSLRPDPARATMIARAGCRRNPYPGALFLLGRTVNVLLSQSLDYELARVEMYNKLIEGGRDAYGDGFLGTLNRIMGGYRNATYRPVRTAHVRPTEDLGQLALDVLRTAPDELILPGASGRIMGAFMGSTTLAESDLLPFLMFTPTYIEALLERGYRDAKAQSE
ncbi:MAG: patatin-like phospholipase family protein, partial [Deltaproteobacteria bacterium]|nr:patatin-like phospholipase family protein [Deltaproteobacteria bacterium]